MIAFE